MIARCLLLAALLCGCTEGRDPVAPEDCILVEQGFTPEPGGVYCMTIEIGGSHE